jgi:ABC-type enterobactin transport system permease subunit
VWSTVDGARLGALLGCLCTACLAVLVLEARRASPSGAWSALTGGLGSGACVSAAAGFFQYDARLESARDSRLGALPAVFASDGAHAGNLLELAAFPLRRSH